MNEKKLQEAIDRQKLCLTVPPIFEQDVKDIELLISLATAYLDVKGWPEEMEEETIDLYNADEQTVTINKEFNSALYLCKLAMVKKCSEENLMGVMLEYSQDSIDPEYIKGLALAIQNYLVGGER